MCCLSVRRRFKNCYFFPFFFTRNAYNVIVWERSSPFLLLSSTFLSILAQHRADFLPDNQCSHMQALCISSDLKKAGLLFWFDSGLFASYVMPACLVYEMFFLFLVRSQINDSPVGSVWTEDNRAIILVCPQVNHNVFNHAIRHRPQKKNYYTRIALRKTNTIIGLYFSSFGFWLSALSRRNRSLGR